MVLLFRARPCISAAICRHESISSKSMGVRAPDGVAQLSLPDFDRIPEGVSHHRIHKFRRITHLKVVYIATFDLQILFVWNVLY